jgi:RNA polymerase sigma factor (sigma-70 family)
MTELLPESDFRAIEPRWERILDCRPAMLRMATARCRSLHDAEDVVGHALEAAFVSAVPDDELGPWLNRVVLNLCAETHRAHYRYLRLTERAVRRADLVEHGHEDRVVARLAAAQITSAVEELPDRQRRVLAMRSQGLPLTDIAQQLNLPYKTVESLLSRARAGLRAKAKALLALVPTLVACRRNWTRIAAGTIAPATLAGFVLALPSWAPLGTAHGPGVTSADSVLAIAGPRLDARPAVAAVPARPAATSFKRPAKAHASTRTVGPRLSPKAGPISAQLGGAERQRPQEDFLQSLVRCVREGPELAPDHVGCRES